MSALKRLFLLFLKLNYYIPDITSQVHCPSRKNKINQAVVQQMLDPVMHTLYADITSEQDEGFMCLGEQRGKLPTKECLHLCSHAPLHSLKMVQALL